MDNFRKDLAKFFADNGITQIEAAEKIGITQQSLSIMIHPDNERPVRPTTKRKVNSAYPEFSGFVAGTNEGSLGKRAADEFDRLMEENPYFRSKVVEYGKGMIIEYLSEKNKISA